MIDNIATDTITVASDCAETNLISQCQKQTPGWEHALAVWVQKPTTGLAGLCLSRLGNHADAQDALQDVTISLLRAIHTFEGRSTLRTWAMRIASNQCNTALRKRYANAMTEQLQESMILFEEERSATPDPVAVKQTQAGVNVTLNQLPGKTREVLQLRFFDDMSLDDMAISLGISLSATKMRLYRSMTQFKDSYGTMEI